MTSSKRRDCGLQGIGQSVRFAHVAQQTQPKTVVLGVTGGIACYKAVELTRLLVKDGFKVQVVMTHGAMEFITPLTFQTLSGQPVASETFNLTQESEIGHINVADSADLFVIAPATASIIGKIAAGIADDLLTTVLMATQAPVLIAPAMNIHMYANPILQENLRKLRRVGYHLMEPADGLSGLRLRRQRPAARAGNNPGSSSCAA